jgi:hypothetical protein
MASTLVCLLSGVIAALVVIYITSMKEGFAILDQNKLSGPAQLRDGIYLIKNYKGDIFASNAFTPIMCNDWIFQTASPSKEASWKLTRVSGGVYRLNKTSDHSQECLFAHENGEVRSYITSFCDFNVCGSDKLSYGDELDPYSIRTYFKIINGPDGKYLLQSLKNNQYIKFDGQKAIFTPNPEDECLFSMERQ